MNIKVSRTRYQNPMFKSVDGQLLIDDETIASTTESALDLLPPGTHPVTLVKCPLHGRKMPHIVTDPLAVRPCKNCKKHPQCSLLMTANSAKECTHGSIAVGEKLVPGVLVRSRFIFDPLYERIRKQLERGKTVSLTVEKQ